MATLPQAALVTILQFVPLEHRLGSCALVNSSWAEAAAAATTSVERRVSSAESAAVVLDWINRHAQHASTLMLSTPCALPLLHAAAVQQLPLWPGLRQLHIKRMKLQLTPVHQSSSTPLQAGLTQLHLIDCFMDGLQGLTALSALSNLQHLSCSVLVPPALQTSKAPALWTLPGSIWPALTALTHLDMLRQANVTDAVLQDLQVLPALQVLRVNAAQLSTRGLAPLQELQDLGRLQLHLAPHIPFSCSTTPWLAAMPSLRSLQLFCWKELQPSLLVSLSSQLRHLELVTHAAHTTPSEAARFLAALAQMTALTALCLEHVLKEKEDPYSMQLQAGGPAEPLLPPAACAALTASSNLCSLKLSQATLPAGAWQQVFAAQRHLPQLRDLSITGVTTCCMDECDLQSLVCCCPGLTALQLSHALQQGVLLAPLVKLSGLRQLRLQHVHGDGAAGVLAQLAGLRVLQDDCAHLSRTGLLRLTVLRQLTHLHTHCSLSTWDLPRLVSITNKAPECFVPDVWRQLQQKLAEHS